jgi:23S rRNA (guanosine2251-2'-O)-methyltransferase
LDLLYGRNAVAEALRAQRRRVHRLLLADGAQDVDEYRTAAADRSVPVATLPRQRLDQLFRGANHQGIVAEVSDFAYVRVTDLVEAELPLLLVLDSLQDPQNFGTLLRTAQATGIDGVVVPEHRAVGVTAAVSNASAGAVEHLRVARETNLARALEYLKSRDVWTYGLAVDASQPYWEVDWRGPSALVVGSEGSGLSRIVRVHCDVLITIPMAPGAVQSLNASVAGSLVLYEGFRQRQTQPASP